MLQAGAQAALLFAEEGRRRKTALSNVRIHLALLIDDRQGLQETRHQRSEVHAVSRSRDAGRSQGKTFV
jgi:hypothetical protein